MKDLADSLKREGFAAAEVRVFRAHHALGDEELSALVAWWLGRARKQWWAGTGLNRRHQDFQS
jgi:hypothetical protein